MILDILREVLRFLLPAAVCFLPTIIAFFWVTASRWAVLGFNVGLYIWAWRVFIASPILPYELQAFLALYVLLMLANWYGMFSLAERGDVSRLARVVGAWFRKKK